MVNNSDIIDQDYAGILDKLVPYARFGSGVRRTGPLLFILLLKNGGYSQ